MEFVKKNWWKLGIGLVVAFILVTVLIIVRTEMNSKNYDCSDFATHQEAQTFFEESHGEVDDVDHLDADHDGIACETLP